MMKSTGPAELLEGTLKRTEEIPARLIFFHIGVAIISLPVTGSASALTGVLVLLLPVATVVRTATLALFTFPAMTFHRRKTALLGAAGLWLVWQSFASGRFTEGIISLLLFGGAALRMFFKYERGDGNAIKNDRYTYVFRMLSALLLFSLVFIFFIEFLQTGDFLTPFASMFSRPDALGCNLIYFTSIGSFVLWIRRPALGGTIYLLVWTGFGVASLFKNMNIYEPVLLPDFFQIFEGISAAVDILGIFGTIAVGAAIAGAIAGLVMLGRKCRKQKFSKRVALISGLFAAALIVCGLLSTFLPWMDFTGTSPREVFSRNGYIYSFITTGYRVIRTKPGRYEQGQAGEIIELIRKEAEKYDDKNAGIGNIVVIQMESFLDPLRIEGAEFERDPIPFIRWLSENYTSGMITVPIFGGQTVKSEFEFLTGFDISNLPYGYNPYTLYLNSTAVDSFPRYLRGNGFATWGIHNYQGEFFQRDFVYRNLGFDRFASYELMSGVKKKEGSIWADDSVILDQIKLAVESGRSEKNFIFAVTVQTHGAYPVLEADEYPLKISGIEDDVLAGKLAYYAGQLEQLDANVKAICEYFAESEEPTVVLMYSDHLPTFAIDVPGIPSENRFTVNFYMWDNIGLEKETPDVIELSSLSTYLCDRLGLGGSFMNHYHRLYDAGADSETFSTVQYFKMFEEPRETAFSNDTYEMGFSELSIGSIEYDSAADTLTVHGKGMTDNTYLCVNGRMYDAEYIDPETIKLTGLKRPLTQGDEITLRIVGEKYGRVLKESGIYEWG